MTEVDLNDKLLFHKF